IAPHHRPRPGLAVLVGYRPAHDPGSPSLTHSDFLRSVRDDRRDLRHLGRLGVPNRLVASHRGGPGSATPDLHLDTGEALRQLGDDAQIDDSYQYRPDGDGGLYF